MVYCNNTKDGRKLKRDCIGCKVEFGEKCEDCCYEHTHKCAEDYLHDLSTRDYFEE